MISIVRGAYRDRKHSDQRIFDVDSKGHDGRGTRSRTGAILAEDHELAEAHERLHLTPDDREAHAAHRERLQAHADRLSAYSVALQQRTAHRSGRMCWTPLFYRLSRLPITVDCADPTRRGIPLPGVPSRVDHGLAGPPACLAKVRASGAISDFKLMS